MKNKKFDILHIRDYYPSKKNIAGSSWVYQQVRDIQNFGFNPLVISPTPYLPSFLRSTRKFYRHPLISNQVRAYLNTIVIRPGYIKLPGKTLYKFSFSNLERCIYKEGIKHRPKLIHAHFGQNGAASIRLKIKLKVPLITSFYGYDSGRLGKFLKPYYKSLIEYGNIFLVLSQNMKEDLIFLGFPEDKIIIHHLGINISNFKPIEFKNNNFTFLCVAGFTEGKGIQDVIQAFSKLSYPNTQLKIVGDGPMRKKYLKRIKNLKLSYKVKIINNFTTCNPRQTVLNEMQICDVFLLTSFISKNGYKEGTPVVLMEAQACGKPCIGTYHAGIPEVIINNQTGFLTKERDIEAIANAMILLYQNNNLRKSLGKNARAHIEIAFNQEKQIANLYNIYNSLL